MTGVGFERRTHRRVDVAATAIVLKRGVDSGRYLVQNLSAAGALLTGGATVEVGEQAAGKHHVRVFRASRGPPGICAEVDVLTGQIFGG